MASFGIPVTHRKWIASIRKAEERENALRLLEMTPFWAFKSVASSKSDVQAHQRNHVKPAKFYTDDAIKPDHNKPVNFELERSRTTVLPRHGPGGDSGALRAAPSPPARHKPAPPPPADLQAFTVHGRLLGAGGILDAAPVNPSRKPSPKHTSSIQVDVSNKTDTRSQDDLIKF